MSRCSGARRTLCSSQMPWTRGTGPPRAAWTSLHCSQTPYSSCLLHRGRGTPPRSPRSSQQCILLGPWHACLRRCSTRDAHGGGKKYNTKRRARARVDGWGQPPQTSYARQRAAGIMQTSYAPRQRAQRRKSNAGRDRRTCLTSHFGASAALAAGTRQARQCRANSAAETAEEAAILYVRVFYCRVCPFCARCCVVRLRPQKTKSGKKWQFFTLYFPISLIFCIKKALKNHIHCRTCYICKATYHTQEQRPQHPRECNAVIGECIAWQ